VKKYKLLVLASLLFLQMCKVVNGYYTDEEGEYYISYEFEDKSGFFVDYLVDRSSGLLNFDHTGREVYDRYFDGCYSFHLGIRWSNPYKIAYFNILLTDVETNEILKEDFIVFGHEIPVEIYPSIERLLYEKKDKSGITFNILYKKEKIENIKNIHLTIKYAFYRNGELVEGEITKKLHRKSRFKLG